MLSFTDSFLILFLLLICAAIEKLPGISCFLFLGYFFERTRSAASMRHLALFTTLLVIDHLKSLPKKGSIQKKQRRETSLLLSASLDKTGE